jgi:hypothetical protein
MPVYVVESADERVFTIDAESEADAIAELARSRRLAPSSLRVVPTPRTEREWGLSTFLWVLGLLGALVLALALG